MINLNQKQKKVKLKKQTTFDSVNVLYEEN